MKHLKHKKGEHLHQIKKAPLKQAIPAPTTQWYFAYGSNMNRKRMFARNAVWNICTSGTLYNHRLVFNKKSKKASEGFANIIKSKEHEVEGILYRLESKHLYKHLDKFECAGTHYNRVEKRIRRADGKFVTAFVYVAILTQKNLQPSEEYLNHLLKGEIYLSPEYMEFLKKTETSINKEMKVFVYGTLKKGFGNHRRLEGATKVEPAQVNGRLYDVGLPYVCMKDSNFSCIATGDIEKDMKSFSNQKTENYISASETVKGELITFSDWSALKGLDSLEGYRPNFMQHNADAIFSNNHYVRVLTTCITAKNNVEPCWIYIVKQSQKNFKKSDQVMSGEYKRFVDNYRADDLTRFEEGLDKHDIEHNTDMNLSYDYLDNDYGIVNSLHEKGEL